MTTPAVNISSDLLVDASQYSMAWNADGSISIPWHLVTAGHAIAKHTTRRRPQSVKNVVDASGWRKPSAYSYEYEQFSQSAPAVTFDTYQRQSGVRYLASRNSFFDGLNTNLRLAPSIPAAGNLLQRAEVSALSKLKSQKVNFGVAFGEYKETAELVSSVATRIAKTVRAFRDKRPSDWGNVVKHQLGKAAGPRPGSRGSGIPKSWLELQYGWNPMMQDVNGACEQLSSSYSGHPYRVTCKGGAKRQLRGQRWGQVNKQYAGVRIQMSGTQYAFVRLDYELSSPALAVFSSLGLTNPLEIAWELVPYSFVVDWFLPVGSWLSSLDADFGWRFLGGSHTEGYEYLQQGNGVEIRRDLHPSDDSEEAYGFVRSTQRNFSFVRSIYSSSPLPRFPGLKNPLSAGHVANALALLAGNFR